jgi:hypothetical protein
VVISFFNFFLLSSGSKKCFCFHGDLKNVGRSGVRESGYQALRYPDIRAEIRHVIKKFVCFGSESVVTADWQQKFENRWQNWKAGGAGIGNH